nr:hypothetical protein BaRGS_005221 [Batillaria attramentaria]
MFTVCRHGAVQGDGAETACCENLFDFNFIRCPVCRENCYISGGIGSLPRIRKERMRRSEMEEVVDVYEKVLSASQSLGRHATTLLETGTTPSILQACGAVRDDLELDMNTVTATCSGRIVDLRRQQAMLRDIHYLNPPDPPAIDVTRCARSVDTVALFLAPPRGTSDVIDTYHIHYCSEEQKALGIEEHRVFGLEADTQYEFVVMASNPRGECQLSQKLLLRTEHGGQLELCPFHYTVTQPA